MSWAPSWPGRRPRHGAPVGAARTRGRARGCYCRRRLCPRTPGPRHTQPAPRLLCPRKPGRVTLSHMPEALKTRELTNGAVVRTGTVVQKRSCLGHLPVPPPRPRAGSCTWRASEMEGEERSGTGTEVTSKSSTRGENTGKGPGRLSPPDSEAAAPRTLSWPLPRGQRCARRPGVPVTVPGGFCPCLPVTEVGCQLRRASARKQV